MKQATVLALSALLISLPIAALAAVEITHVEYDPAGNDKGREWIEITNKGESSVDLTKWKLQEAGVKHALTAQSSSILPAGAAAIIASDPATYINEHADTTQLLFKSSFSLSNTGESLALINAKGGVENSLIYTAAKKASTTPPPNSKKTSVKTATSTKFVAAGGFGDANLPQGKSNTPLPWLAGLGGIILLGVAGVFLVPSKKLATEGKSQAEEFEIE